MPHTVIGVSFVEETNNQGQTYMTSEEDVCAICEALRELLASGSTEEENRSLHNVSSSSHYLQMPNAAILLVQQELSMLELTTSKFCSFNCSEIHFVECDNKNTAKLDWYSPKLVVNS